RQGQPRRAPGAFSRQQGPSAFVGLRIRVRRHAHHPTTSNTKGIATPSRIIQSPLALSKSPDGAALSNAASRASRSAGKAGAGKPAGSVIASAREGLGVRVGEPPEIVGF